MNLSRVVPLAVFLGLATTGAPASVLLHVDVSNPSAVLISATGAAPIVAEDTVDNYSGVSLLDFALADAFANGLAPAATLQANGTSQTYNEWWFDNFGNGPRALNLYFGDAPNATPQIFDPGQPAFTGVFELNLSGVALPPVGYQGHILAGDSSGPATVIGAFAIIPEPGTLVLVGIALGSLLFFRPRP